MKKVFIKGRYIYNKILYFHDIYHILSQVTFYGNFHPTISPGSKWLTVLSPGKVKDADPGPGPGPGVSQGPGPGPGKSREGANECVSEPAPKS